MLTVEGAVLFDFERSDGQANNAFRLPVQSPPGAPVTSRLPSLEEVEREHIVAVLKEANWRIEGERGAAKLLNLQPSTLRSRMQKLVSSGIRISSGLIQRLFQRSPATMRGGHGISWRQTSWPRWERRSQTLL